MSKEKKGTKEVKKAPSENVNKKQSSYQTDKSSKSEAPIGKKGK
ncbi:hypothetical protein GCM10023149_13490 [Mucilaginibacter gynuensis]|uniref:Uncharacterized protein n=1 Tax=Mucilaginibacter gynuensis TaxID=1302236 RepID=A0ABP8G3S4_9SPHI